MRFFKLEGSRYREQTLNISAPQIWIPELELGLGLWEGTFRGPERLWMRWCDAEGDCFLTPEEEARVAQQEVEATRAALQAAELARRASISQLLAMGLSPEQVAAALNLSLEEVDRDSV